MQAAVASGVRASCRGVRVEASCYADDFVVCWTRKACEEAERRIREILKRAELSWHLHKMLSEWGYPASETSLKEKGRIYEC